MIERRFTSNSDARTVWTVRGRRRVGCSAATGAMLALLGALGACGGEPKSERSADGGDTGTAGEAPVIRPAPNASGNDGGGAASTSGTADASMAPQLVALGDCIFHGKAGGTCQTCHGPDAKGTPLAPNLTDSQWLNGDGSYQFISTIITNGVPQPKQHPSPMPPMGGAQLTRDQVRAVAAYVYSLSHRGS